MLKCKLILAFLDADWVGPQQPVCNFYDQILSSHVEYASLERAALADSCERINIARLHDYAHRMKVNVTSV